MKFRKRRKAAGVKKVLDATFEVIECTEDKDRFLLRLTGFFIRLLNGEKNKMSFLGEIVESIKTKPLAPKPPIPAKEVWLALWGTIIGIGITAWMAFTWKCPLLLGPFGASAVLIYAAYKAPLAQPRNVLLGHFIGACMGVIMYDFFGLTWWCLALGVALTIILTMVTYSVHPPAGATAYVAIQTGGLGVGYGYILNPVLLGAFILLLVAVIFNKLGKRDYPANWW